MNFDPSNPLIAAVNPPSDSSPPFETIVTGVAPGTAAVTATAVLSNGSTLQSARATVNVSPASVCPAGTREKTVTLPQTSSLAVSYDAIVKPSSNCGRDFWTYSALSQANNIPINHSRVAPAPGFSWCPATYKETTREAVFNFSGFNIPKGADIKSATLLSSSSGGCQAGSVAGSANNVNPFSSSGSQLFSVPFLSFPFDSSKFGSGAKQQTCTLCQASCPLPSAGLCSFACGGFFKPSFVCGTSSNPSGTGDVTSIIQGIVSSQNLTQAAFKIRPEYSDFTCFASNENFTLWTANFSVNSPGPARLSIDYCEPLYSVSGNVFVDENKNKLKEGKEVNFDKGISNIEVHTGIDALCSAATLGIPTPIPTPIPVPSCVASVGGNCNSALCCSPLVCTAIDIYTKQCRGTPPAPTPTPTAAPTPAPINTLTGSYTTGKILPAGTYTLCYKNLPVTYKTTFPTTLPVQLNLTVGPGCSGGTSNSATCGVLPTPTPAPAPGCKPIGPVGASCSGVTCCSGLTCIPGDIYNAPRCPAPTPTPLPLNRDIINANFGIVPDIFSISGAIFTDANGDLKKNPLEPNYLGPVRISVTNGFANFAVNNSSGSYSSNNLPQGQYTITFSGLPQGNVFTYPSTPLIVRVGSICSFPITSEAGCSANSVINLNAGVTNSVSSWFQSIGSDMRWDSGFSNDLPKNKFASILGSGGMPGIIFSGSSSPNFGAGSASQSPFNWIVGSFTHPEVFTDTHNLIPTSYRFLLETVEGSGITKKTVGELCSNGNSFNCTLNPGLVHGVYWIGGNSTLGSDLTLNGSGYTFPPSQDFVILINGDLNINEEIHVPTSSTVIFSAKGNITVNQNVGETLASSTSSSIEGLYSADNNFIADAITKNCPIADLRLNVAGTVIANAGRGGGTFVNRRDLCSGNSSFPSVSFIERPDFMLNYPSLAGYNPRSWREVAP